MPELILASGSQIRRKILEDAGIAFSVVKSAVDEDALKLSHGELSPENMALFLAQAKAGEVSQRLPDALILAADQTMELDGQLLDKLPRRELAPMRLAAMRGKPHYLHSGLVLMLNGKTVWTHQQTSTLTVRDFSEDFLADYLERAGDELTASVGAYAYEGLGAHLFEHVDGDFHAILGLPLLPLLAALRDQGILAR